MSKQNRTIEFERTFHAPIQLVWEVWTQKEHIINWWSPPGMVTTINTYEFKEGGEWEYTMSMPNGQSFVANGRFIAIETMRKISTEANFAPKTVGVHLESFFEQDGMNTKFQFHIVHPSEEYRTQQEKMGVAQGWEAALDRLGELLWNIS